VGPLNIRDLPVLPPGGIKTILLCRKDKVRYTNVVFHTHFGLKLIFFFLYISYFINWKVHIGGCWEVNHILTIHRVFLFHFWATSYDHRKTFFTVSWIFFFVCYRWLLRCAAWPWTQSSFIRLSESKNRKCNTKNRKKHANDRNCNSFLIWDFITELHMSSTYGKFFKENFEKSM